MPIHECFKPCSDVEARRIAREEIVGALRLVMDESNSAVGFRNAISRAIGKIIEKS